MGLAYIEDLEQMVGFASHLLDCRDGSRPIFGSEEERHNHQKLLGRMRICERLWAPLGLPRDLIFYGFYAAVSQCFSLDT